MRVLLLLFALSFPPASFSQPLSLAEVAKLGSEEIEPRLQESDPSVFYAYASKLFAAGARDAAVLWFYVGQVRFRFALEAASEEDPLLNRSVFESLNHNIGSVINEWAGGDIDTWISQIQKALEWDDQHKNVYTSKMSHEKEYKSVRAGLKEMSEELQYNKERFREMRIENGLTNRAK